MTKILKIGTRTSALAMAQTRLVVHALKHHHPDLEIEVVGVKNVTGDVDKKTPLQELGTIGVFTKEIDDMVLAGTVDCAVHSLKDIGTKRPGTLTTLCIPERAQPHDCILFHPDILTRIKSGKRLVLGASSPRRHALVPDFLNKALPRVNNKTHKIDMVPLRGNVPTRLQKMLGLTETEHALDGVVLAFAGLSRLFADPDAHGEIANLLNGVKWMVLPLTACPGAPGQGAMAVEGLNEREDLKRLFAPIHDRKTAADVALERAILIENGGGCHQAFGATAIKIAEPDERALIIRGLNEDGVDVSETRWLHAHDSISLERIWNGLKWRDDVFQTDYVEHPPIHGDAVFVSHARAVSDSVNSELNEKRIWTAGINSWFRLAEKGLWVEGCADGFGYDLLIRTLLTDPVLGLPPCSGWNILTHEGASQHWDEDKGHVVPTYRLDEKPSPKALDALKQADHIFWSSYSQFEALRNYAPANAVHMCGTGKTAEKLRAAGIQPVVLSTQAARSLINRGDE